MLNKIEEAIDSIKQGKMVIVVDDAGEENEGILFMAAERISKESINFMINELKGSIAVALNEKKLEKEGFYALEDDKRKTYFTSLDYVEAKSGISSDDKLLTIKKIADGNSKRNEFRIPGHILISKAAEGGVLKKASKFEAAADVVALAGAGDAAVTCEILNSEGSVAKLLELYSYREKYGIKIISIEDLIAYRRERECYVSREAEASLPTAYGNFKMVGYINKLNGEHHVALVKGDIDVNDEVLVRVHSECLTGDAFHSLKCDCGEQLAAALAAIEKEGKGVLLYLRQEGRGIGLINKIKAYKLQEEGLDTEEANIALGFPADMRDYGIGAQILRDLNVRKIRLMTNNPKKLIGLKGYDIEVVERVPIVMETNLHNAKYFKTKKEKMGHMY